MASIKLGKMVQPQPANEGDVEASYLRAAHVQPDGRIIDVDDKTMWFRPDELAELDLCSGDVVVVEGGAGYGRSAVLQSDRPGWGFQNSINRVRAGADKAAGRFVNYVLQRSLASGETELLVNTATIPHFTAEKVAEVRAPFPAVEEQRTIADFLDREIGQIDAMVGSQLRLVALLTERRKAAVLYAVTKGLRPNRTLKDSGELWSGDIPGDWAMRRISLLFRTIGSGTTPANEDLLDDGDHYWVTTGELRESVITSTERSVSRETLLGSSVLRLYAPGTLIIAMYGATIGRLGVLGVTACVNQACCALAEPQGGVSPAFVYYSLLAVRDHLIYLASGGGQPNINQEKIRSLRLPVPSHSEQLEIVAHLDVTTARIDAMIAKAQESIALMKERRAALISAAVTGRLDVRSGIEQVERDLEGAHA
ncbi:restriction endonuclease subunit S [Georgenia subflava]|uniref:restriction endonuclease subunit S n=1 Tax=Georgenia subflava TaxID=1622177 RepID=UPI00186AEF91|nr:restriction endonuclease subunit S [Georgenia subflava]